MLENQVTLASGQRSLAPVAHVRKTFRRRRPRPSFDDGSVKSVGVARIRFSVPRPLWSEQTLSPGDRAVEAYVRLWLRVAFAALRSAVGCRQMHGLVVLDAATSPATRDPVERPLTAARAT